ncbi:hypothetical protein [Pseudomonas sp. NA-150]|uniref:hypothetical protein n=1 Tax=Pseudomonas sp. NA-150 TaxID=3367525 RepID=UPI0037CC9C60
MKQYKISGTVLSIASLIIAVGISVIDPYRAQAWAVTALALVLFCAGIGYGINGHYYGLLIDNRNRVSLSKLQASAWTVLVLSALLAAAMARVKLNAQSPIDIDIPPALLAVMGISATSLVATPIILSAKDDGTAPGTKAEQTAEKLGDTHNLASSGRVYARSDPDHARWLDIFRGDEVGNAASPDLSKLQQFLITAVTLIIYASALWHLFDTPPDSAKSIDCYLNTLPVFSAHMAWLIGISHAGYLTYKAAPHGSNTPQPAASQASDVKDGSVG